MAHCLCDNAKVPESDHFVESLALLAARGDFLATCLTS